MKHARPDYNRIQDPLNGIKEDEPVFLLRAQDKSAPAAVRAWARLNAENGGSSMLTALALEQATAMENWQAENSCKPADLLKETFAPQEYPEASSVEVDLTPKRLKFNMQVGDEAWFPSKEELAFIQTRFQQVLLEASISPKEIKPYSAEVTGMDVFVTIKPEPIASSVTITPSEDSTH